MVAQHCTCIKCYYIAHIKAVYLLEHYNFPKKVVSEVKWLGLKMLSIVQ